MASSQPTHSAIELQAVEIGLPQQPLENGHCSVGPSPHPSDSNETAEHSAHNVTLTKQRWNHPRRNMWKVFAAFICFSIVGANDGAYGVSCDLRMAAIAWLLC